MGGVLGRVGGVGVMGWGVVRCEMGPIWATHMGSATGFGMGPIWVSPYASCPDGSHMGPI